MLTCIGSVGRLYFICVKNRNYLCHLLVSYENKQNIYKYFEGKKKPGKNESDQTLQFS